MCSSERRPRGRTDNAYLRVGGKKELKVIQKPLEDGFEFVSNKLLNLKTDTRAYFQNVILVISREPY